MNQTAGFPTRPPLWKLGAKPPDPPAREENPVAESGYPRPADPDPLTEGRTRVRPPTSRRTYPDPLPEGRTSLDSPSGTSTLNKRGPRRGHPLGTAGRHRERREPDGGSLRGRAERAIVTPCWGVGLSSSTLLGAVRGPAGRVCALRPVPPARPRPSRAGCPPPAGVGPRRWPGR